jgi:signal transduction histidine kinase
MAEPAQAIGEELPLGRPLAAVPSDWEESPGSMRQARGRRVARDLVELSRLQKGAERAVFSQFDLADLLRTACAEYPGVRLEGPAHFTLNADPRRLMRVLFTLLDNAYLHASPPVTVSFDATEIRVEDSGGGFAARVLDRVAQPFVTGDRSHGRGVGLSLAIAARQAALLGGALELGNSQAGGAVARLLLASNLAALPTA